MNNLILFGATGGLGRAISTLAREADRCVRPISWAEASAWTPDEVRTWVENAVGDGPTDVLFATGLTDPAEPADRLMASNLSFPRQIIEAAQGREGLRFMTFGSVMERGQTPDEANAYIASKLALGEFVSDLTRNPDAPAVLHLRLHTLYGAPVPHRHMFMGQIAESLRAGTQFEMSAGLQYRQYHHVDDIARAILGLLDQASDTRGVLEINGPETVRLVDLARAVFSHFGKLENLRVGTLPMRDHEVLDPPDYPPSPAELFPYARPTIPGVTKWLEQLLAVT